MAALAGGVLAVFVIRFLKLDKPPPRSEKVQVPTATDTREAFLKKIRARSI